MTRVLVVEDDPQLVRALVINLQARRYGVDPAPDGTTALRIAAARQPDVVLLDLGLPDMDGTDVIKALRGWTRVPILVLSARRASDEKVAALDAGADDYITKPFSMDELLARLRAAVRRRDDVPPPPRRHSSRPTASPSTSSPRRPPAPGTTYASPPPNGTCWRSWSPTPAASSPRNTSWPRSGESASATRPTTCGSTWPNSAANSRPTPPTPATSSPNPAWDTASKTEARVRNRRREPRLHVHRDGHRRGAGPAPPGGPGRHRHVGRARIRSCAHISSSGCRCPLRTDMLKYASAQASWSCGRPRKTCVPLLFAPGS